MPFSCRVLGFAGEIGSGKDECARILYRTHPEIFRIWGLADPIKKIAEIFGFTKEQLNDTVSKELVDPYWGISCRRFMEIVGTKLFRKEFGEDVWIKLARLEMNKYYKRTFIFPDVRYKSDWEFIKSWSGKIIYVQNEKAYRINLCSLSDETRANSNNPVGTTLSGVEQDCVSNHADAVIVNDCDIKTLAERLRQTLKGLGYWL